MSLLRGVEINSSTQTKTKAAAATTPKAGVIERLLQWTLYPEVIRVDLFQVWLQFLASFAGIHSLTEGFRSPSRGLQKN